MSELIEHDNAGELRIAHINYALLALGLFTGWLAAIVAMLLIYAKRDDTRDAWLASHYSYQLRTFWWGLGWTALGWILLFLVIGVFGPTWIIWGGAWLWGAYRVIKGWLRLNDRREVD